MPYDVFISYSYEADALLAERLQQGLQRFAKPWYRRAALSVFRDQSALTANPGLWTSITQAMDASRYFVLLASRHAASSEWVQREVGTWCAAHPPETLFIALTDGDIVWDDRIHDFDPTQTTALPAALAGYFGEQPRWVDLRWARGEPDIDLRHTRFRDAVAEFAAPMHGVAKDDLESEDLRLHRRARRLARGGVTVLALLVVVALVASAMALQQRASAQHQASVARREAAGARREATVALAGKLAAEAGNALHGGQDDLALLLAVEANRLVVSPQTRGALLTALIDQPDLERVLHGLSHRTYAVAFSPDGSLLAAATDQSIGVWDVRTGRPVTRPLPFRSDTPDSVPQQIAFADGGRLIVVQLFDSDRLLGWDVRTGHRVASAIKLPLAKVSVVPTWVANPKTADVVVESSPSLADIVDLASGQVRGQVRIPANGQIAVAPSGSTVAVASVDQTGEVIRGWNLDTALPVGPGCHMSGSTEGQTVGNGGFGFVTDRLLQSLTMDEYDSRGGRLLRCDLISGRLSTERVTAPPGTSLSAVSANGRLVAGRATDGSMQLSDPNGSAVTASMRAPWSSFSAGGGGSLLTPIAGSVVFSPDGRFVSATETNGEVRVWSAARRISQWTKLASLGAYTTVEPDANGDAVLAATPDRIDIIRLSDQHRLATLAIPADMRAGPLSAALSADGKIAAIATDRGLVVLDAAAHTSRQVAIPPSTCTDVEGLPVTITFHPLGIVKSCTPSGAVTNFHVQRIDVSTATPRVESPILVDAPTFRVTVSPNNQTLVATGVSAENGGYQLLSIGPTGVVRHPEVQDFPTSIDFTHDGRALTADEIGGTIELWSARGDSRSELVRDLHHPIVSLASSPDDSLVAGLDDTGTISLWDLASTTLLASFPSALPTPTPVSGDACEPANCLAFASDGTSLIEIHGSPAGNGHIANFTLWRWSLDLQTWEREACTIANRNLTSAEWSQYAGTTPYERTCT